MISSKSDYTFYLEKDKEALEITRKFPLPFRDEVWKFERLMRKIEYYQNCKSKIFKVYLLLLKFKYRKLSIKLGFTIPINIFDYGLSIAHYGTIIINPEVKIGNNCRIHCCVNIGGTGKLVPSIGDNCYIGPGAKIFGDIKIGDNVKISKCGCK
jgi:serine O-acetyltransferase